MGKVDQKAAFANRELFPMLAFALLVPTVLCGCAAKPQTEQDKAAAEIKRLGGHVGFDEKNPGRPVVSVQLSGSRVKDDCLRHLKGLTGLQTLNLERTQVTDAGLERLQGADANSRS